MHTDEIKRKIASLYPGLREKYGVKGLWLFGSFVRGEEKTDSDVDILVEFENEHLSLLDFIELEILLSRHLEFPVDLVEKSALKPVIGERILSEAELV